MRRPFARGQKPMSACFDAAAVALLLEIIDNHSNMLYYLFKYDEVREVSVTC